MGRTTATLAEVETFDVTQEIDPGTFSVIMGMYENIGREMMITLERLAWTLIINLCRDFSVGIADDACNLVSVPDTALPVQAMTMQRIMKSTAEFFEGEIEDGDVLMCNLAYLGNTHMGDGPDSCPAHALSVSCIHSVDTCLGAF